MSTFRRMCAAVPPNVSHCGPSSFKTVLHDALLSTAKMPPLAENFPISTESHLSLSRQNKGVTSVWNLKAQRRYTSMT